MAEKKKTNKPAKKKNTKPVMRKDGTIKWGDKVFKNEKEFSDYLLKTTLFIDGEKK